jgi:predicted Ser/Thr protein kinase
MKHLEFCPPGTPYFDVAATVAGATENFPVADQPSDDGWQRSIGPDWVMMSPTEVALPIQGWKIHVSATLDNAARVLDLTWKYAVERKLAFKFIRSTKVLERRNGKYGDRSASGKFITIYPADEAQLATVLRELGDQLNGEQGPYILSDLRWQSGPLYVRYGAFAALTKRGEHGNVVHCIKAPDGQLVPDRRSPGFHPPEWAPLPEVLQEALAARNAGTLEGFPYAVEKALHYSNGGGIYRATDNRSGERVLLREARPLAGVDSNGDDAVARLQREHEVLQRLAGLACVPRLFDYRVGYEHYFLVREYVEGEPLIVELQRRHPLCGEGPEDGLAAYTEWALGVLDRVEDGVQALHQRGVVFGDLHPGNILIRPDDSVCFIDFETASTDPQARQFQGAPGFVVPADCRGPAVDRYMLGSLRIAMFVPLSWMLPWGTEKAEQLIEFIRAHFAVGADFAGKVLADLGPWAAPAPAARPRRFRPAAVTAQQEVVDGILATATPERTDRLFPGDAAQFATPEGGASFAHGAAGVLWALAETQSVIPGYCVDWLERTALGMGAAAPGFYNGLCGIAFTLDRLGRTRTALELLDRVRQQGTDQLGDDLFAGRAGVGLTELHFARQTGEQAGIDRAKALAERIIERSATAPGRFALGLMRGGSGGALLLLRLHEETGDPAYLEAAQRLLHSDLGVLGWTGQGWAAGAPGLRSGVALGANGTGMVVHQFLTHRYDPVLAAARDRIGALARRSFARAVGLFPGHVGTILTLLSLGDAPESPALQTHRDYLGLLAVYHNERVSFLGYEGLRISTDLATGAAGALLALEAMVTDRRLVLPFV